MRLLAFLILACSMPAWAAPEIVGLRDAQAANGSGGAITITSFVVPTHTGPSHVVVGVCTENGGGTMTVNSVTWGGATGSQVVSGTAANSDRNTAYLWLVPNVTPGTADLTVTFGYPFHRAVIAGVLHDVGVAEATSNTGVPSGTSISSPVTTASASAFAVDVFCGANVNANPQPTGIGQTLVQSLPAGAHTIALSKATGPQVPGTTPMSWSFTGSQRAAVAVAAFPDDTPGCAGCDYIPDDTLMINVLDNPYPQCQGIVGDGVNDDTAAINACLTYWGPTGIFFPGSSDQRETLYFPADHTFRITGTIRPNAEDDRLSFLCGPGAKFKLDDASAGFADSCTPKAALYAGNPGAAAAFQNDYRGCEIDLGNNPGAIGLDYVGNNVVSVREMFIHGTAFHTGIAMTRQVSGPVIFKGNRVEGGLYGFDISRKYMSAVLDSNVTVGQTIEGRRIGENAVTLLDEESSQTGGKPALHVASVFWPPLVSVIRGTFANSGGSNSSAIVVDDGANGYRVFARDIDAPGYTNALKRGVNLLPSPLAEWVSHAVHTVFTSPTTSLDLPLPPHPHYVHPNPADWVNACDLTPCDAATNGTAVMQGLVNPGGPKVIYCSGGLKFGQLDIPPGSNLERIQGFDCSLGGISGVGGPWITNRSSNDVEISNITVGSSAPSPRIRHEGTGAMIVTDVTQAFPYECQAGAGPLFIENASILGITTCGNDLVARQLNQEAVPVVTDGAKLVVDGGTAVVIGHKHENRSLQQKQMLCKNGAQCEVFGGFSLGANGLNTSTVPLWECRDASCFITWATTVDNPINPIQVRAVRNGSTADLLSSTTASRGQGEMGFFSEQP